RGFPGKWPRRKSSSPRTRQTPWARTPGSRTVSRVTKRKGAACGSDSSALRCSTGTGIESAPTLMDVACQCSDVYECLLTNFLVWNLDVELLFNAGEKHQDVQRV